MKYILIMMWSIHNSAAHTIAVEFNTLQACQSASVEIQKQRTVSAGTIKYQSDDVMLCVPKG